MVKETCCFLITEKFDRVQCAFISTDEVESIVNAIDEQMGYDEAYPLPDYQPESDGNNAGLEPLTTVTPCLRKQPDL